MGRDLERIRVNVFRGLGLDGLASDEPVIPYRGQLAQAFLSDSRNLHTPKGKLTNEGGGYEEQAASPDGTNPWRYLGWLIRSDGNKHLFGIMNGKLFDQGNLTGSWGSAVATGLDTSERWTGEQYVDRVFLANGVDDPSYYDGTNFRGWIITGPTAAPTLGSTGTGGAGNFTAGDYQYLYLFKRSSDGWLSPASASATITAVGNEDTIDLSAIQVSSQAGVDKVRIYRTTSGGSVFRFRAEINNGVTTYNDGDGRDSALTLEECEMIEALDALQFDIVAVAGDMIYVAGLTESGVARPNRVRFCFPGKPYRFDALDYTDETEQEVTALVKGDRAVIAATAKATFGIQHIGGGVHITEPLDAPGCAHEILITRALEGVAAWSDGIDVYLVKPGGSLENLADPAAGGSSIRSLLTENVDWGLSWLSVYGQEEYLVLAISLAGGEPDTLLAYDLARESWWRFEYGGTYPVEVVNSTVGKKQLLIGQADGSIIEAFTGQDADGALLTPKFTIGPTSMNIENRKRFRGFDVNSKLLNDLDLRLGYEVDPKGQSGNITVALEPSGDVLDVDFYLDTSSLASEGVDRAHLPIGTRGEYLTVTAEERNESFAGRKWRVQSVDLTFQVLS